MSNQLNPIQRKIARLATLSRGQRTRDQLLDEAPGISKNTYSNFESGSTWPRPATRRAIEELHGWKPGIIDDALDSGIHPSKLTLAHMRGEKSFGGRTSIQDFSNDEFFADLPRRVKEIEDLAKQLRQHSYTYAASDDLGGIEPDQLED